VSDYRDDRGALRARNEELEEQLEAATTSLAEQERELADLRKRVLPEPVLPAERPERPIPDQLRAAHEGPALGRKRSTLAWGAVAVLTLLIASMFARKGLFGLRQPTLFLLALVCGAVLAVAMTWPRKA
jgi:hypothetical protein